MTSQPNEPMAVVALWRGHEIRALRESLRMGVRAFAEHLGVSERQLWKWEGQYAIPDPMFQSTLDTALAIAPAAVRARFAEWPSRSRRLRPGDQPRWVVHIPADVTEQATAADLARHIAVLLDALPQIDPGEITLSREDHQLRRVGIFCQKRIKEGRRCGRPADHRGFCQPGTWVMANRFERGA